jgi:Fe-S-cluster-containing dehydrogenase component/anaerobic selenocysteine-containing dehydrogenase
MDRRTFLKIAGMGSMALAAGCSPDPDRKLFTLVHAPDDMVVGQPQWYATTCRECPAGCGVIAKNREGRVIKLEGNPAHPVNQGALCMRGQAALQGLYDPDRIRSPLLKTEKGWQPVTAEDALALMRGKTVAAARKGPERIQFWTEVMGAPLYDLAAATLSGWNAPAPMVYEAFGYEALKAANTTVFGIDGLFAYRMEAADVLVSFGADFLETWLSPVSYARQFKAMHRIHQGRKGRFFHVAPFQSLTGANADVWVPCHPETETLVALALIQIGLDVGRANHLPFALREVLETVVSRHPKAAVLEQTGVPEPVFDLMARRLFQSQSPLVIGTGAGGSGINSYATNVAVNLLNIILNPDLPLLAFEQRYRVETAARQATVQGQIGRLRDGRTDLLLLHNTNPIHTLPPDSGMAAALQDPAVFVISFSNVMDETSALADLVMPVQLPLETWDAYEGVSGAAGLLQPALGRLTSAPSLGDVLLKTAMTADATADTYKTYLPVALNQQYGGIAQVTDWIKALQSGGLFAPPPKAGPAIEPAQIDTAAVSKAFHALVERPLGPVLIAAPSIRYFDGRGANKAWLNEIPDPLSMVAWQTPVLMHPETAADLKVRTGDLVTLQREGETVQAPVYAWTGIRPDVMVMGAGQGHGQMGRFARDKGSNPFRLLRTAPSNADSGPTFLAYPITVQPAGKSVKLATTSGSRVQHDRKIALRTSLKALRHPGEDHVKPGLTMWDFPLTLPLPEGYDPKRDFFPPHDHDGYRWAMVVDLDRCIGCSACAAACYAENNLGVVMEQRIVEGREMAWLQVQRYLDPATETEVTFLPMLCQHCDNAPCESVCPVYAPHHNKEGLNNQIYNRCIGTRFCLQNCPYKVRRFNWFTWQWPEPLNLQLNPDVTVRSKGVMEKCSFCVQRIKAAHNVAKNEKRAIRDGEVTPACVQTCPTGALTFGSLMDPASRVTELVKDPRAYQVMGYLNTKPAVIYLKKVVQEV